ncbi:MAG: sigma-70 family RNA polymerase sigma factor [Chloroflexi bacterium]|nr:sigma-70 family RNA polymerase sigma factor [Chloroflexota bacterium]
MNDLSLSGSLRPAANEAIESRTSYAYAIPAMNSEDTLIRVRRLDAVTLTKVHDRFYADVYRYVRFRLDDEQLCEDITSEVFVRLLDALHKQRGPQINLRGWLIGAASNLVNDHLRKRYARPEESLEAGREYSDGKRPEHAYEDAWQQAEVRQAVRQLTPEQQHVLALRFADEFSLDETASLMGKSVTAIKALQFRAMAALRRILDERLHG